MQGGALLYTGGVSSDIKTDTRTRLHYISTTGIGLHVATRPAEEIGTTTGLGWALGSERGWCGDEWSGARMGL